MLFLMPIEAPLPMNDLFVCVSFLLQVVWLDSFDLISNKESIGTYLLGNLCYSLSPNNKKHAFNGAYR